MPTDNSYLFDFNGYMKNGIFPLSTKSEVQLEKIPRVLLKSQKFIFNMDLLNIVIFDSLRYNICN